MLNRVSFVGGGGLGQLGGWARINRAPLSIGSLSISGQLAHTAPLAWQGTVESEDGQNNNAVGPPPTPR